MDYENIGLLGFCASTRFELELLEKTGLYKTSFKIHGSETRLDTSKEIILYRILQESLNNIIKHASATAIEIIMTFSVDQLILQIKDNGKGFDLLSLEKENVLDKGAGIKNITKRAQLIQASLEIKPMPSYGTTILLIVPLTGATSH